MKVGLFGGGWEDYLDALNEAFDRHVAESMPPHPFGASVDAIMTGYPDTPRSWNGDQSGLVGGIGGAASPAQAAPDSADQIAGGVSGLETGGSGGAKSRYLVQPEYDEFASPKGSSSFMDGGPYQRRFGGPSDAENVPGNPDLARDANGNVITETVVVTPRVNTQRLAQILGIGEGNYESYNTGTSRVPGGGVGHSYVNPPPGTVTGKTINQVLNTDPLPGTDPNRMFAVGAYQIIPKTLRGAVAHLGLTGDELLTPEMQDRIFRDHLIPTAGNGALGRFLYQGEGTVDQAQYAAARQWASVAVPAGYRTGGGSISDGTKTYYGGGANRANAGETQALRAFLESLAQ